MQTEDLCNRLLTLAKGKRRFLVAIAGAPGSGKSTLAEALRDSLIQRGETAVAVPMDGFHLDNSILRQRGLLERKGSPATFDATGFLHLISRLSANDVDVVIPVFDRSRDIAIAGAEVVSKDTRFIVVEGNYLLLKHVPWSGLQEYWDLTVFIDTPPDVLEKRLIQRWLDNGLDEKAARKRAAENDIPNAKLVLEQSASADVKIG